jgi:hypothetical protein
MYHQFWLEIPMSPLKKQQTQRCQARSANATSRAGAFRNCSRVTEA